MRRFRIRVFMLPVAILATAAIEMTAADLPKETVAEQFAKRAARLWSLQPVVKPEVPASVTTSHNPIDAFVAAMYQEKVF